MTKEESRWAVVCAARVIPSLLAGMFSLGAVVESKGTVTLVVRELYSLSLMCARPCCEETW